MDVVIIIGVYDRAEKSEFVGNYWIFEFSEKCDGKCMGLFNGMLMLKNKNGTRKKTRLFSIFVLPERIENNRLIIDYLYAIFNHIISKHRPITKPTNDIVFIVHSRYGIEIPAKRQETTNFVNRKRFK